MVDKLRALTLLAVFALRVTLGTAKGDDDGFAPSGAPSQRPEPAPSDEPTPAPTQRPSITPTPAPTAVPFPLPTRIPTPAPSALPQPFPTHAPTPLPTPQPSIECASGTYRYRMFMFDTSGDGWGSATYALFSSTSLAELGEGALVASGTLVAGAEGSDWLCLADGCYELIVGGGSADSEIGFEFVDEVRPGEGGGAREGYVALSSELLRSILCPDQP